MTFGSYIKDARLARYESDRSYSVRQVAARIGVEPAYLSKIERDVVAPPSETTITALAGQLDLDPDVLLAMAGKVSADLQAVIRKRPALFAKVLRELRDVPDGAVLEVVRLVRDGDW
ncbi:MAG: XRE family transcriptional regulator [Oceanococcus sp.]|nr:MAG: XRE family transcriptional regulator [Oceanococcus sp.]